jgi:sulfide:quinone oxidoreductase
MTPQRAVQHQVVIVGGGVAALETALALQRLSPERTARTIVAPNADYVVQAQTVREPFALPAADRYPLASIVGDAGATLVAEALARVDAAARTITTTEGAVIPYDSLVLALGASPRTRYEHAVTVAPHAMAPTLRGVLDDIDAGTIRSIAFLTPTGPSWPLPLYELAYLTARHARERGIRLATTLVTPEDVPLSLFGSAASRAIERLLLDGGVDVVASSEAEVPNPGEFVLSPGERRVHVDRIIALPELLGPAIPGTPHDAHGFLPVDPHGRVIGVEGIYAAGDATSYRIKHGGFSAQQADAVASLIASTIGEDVEAHPVGGDLRGMFITGGAPLFFSARFEGGHAYDSTVTPEPTVEPERKISARYLSEYLAARA